MSVEFFVDHSRSDSMPDGIAKNATYAEETAYYAVADARAEADQEGVREAFDRAAPDLEADLIEFHKTTQRVTDAAIEEMRAPLAAILGKINAARVACFKAKADGYEPAEPQAKTRGTVYTASRLDYLIWICQNAIASAAGLFGVKVPAYTIGLGASKVTNDPLFVSGNRNVADKLRSEAGSGSGGIGIGGHPFSG
jgi:hypothetical protein